MTRKASEISNKNHELYHDIMNRIICVQPDKFVGIYLSINQGNGYRCYLQPHEVDIKTRGLKIDSTK